MEEIENNINEIAVIFEPFMHEEEGVLEEIPIDIVEGYYDIEDNRFIDSNLYSYSHVTNTESGKSYAFRHKINDLILLYPESSLNDIKKKIFKKYFDNRYYIGTLDDEKVILFKDKKNNTQSIAIDCDSAEKLMMFYDFDGLEDEFLEYDRLVNHINEELNEKHIEEDNSFNDNKINAHKLFNDVKKVVKGQDDAIKKIVTTIWKNYNTNDRANNLMVIGPSGCGKTEIFRQLASMLNVPLLVTNVTGMAQAGYRGNSTEDILSSLLITTKGDLEKASRAIIILDEFDKIAYRQIEDGKISTMGVQNELLKIVEDGSFLVEYPVNGVVVKKMLNTSHITFVAVGAFVEALTVNKNKQVGFNNDIIAKEVNKETIKDSDIINYGIKPELVGRMGDIVRLNELSLDNLKDIIKNSKKSVYTSNIEFIKTILPKITIEDEDALIEEIAKKVKEKNNKTGARGINNVIEEMFSDIFFDISDTNNKYKEVVINKELVNNPKKYVLKK